MMALMCLCVSCKQTMSDEEVAKVTKFLTDMINDQSCAFEGEWVKQHCSDQMIEKLKDAYDYECEDGECYGSWILLGYEGGEDLPQELTGVRPDPEADGYFLAVFELNENAKLPMNGLRVLRYKVSLNDGIPVIEDVEKTADYSCE